MAARALPNARLTAPRNVRAAVVQAASVAFDRDGTLDRVEALAARAAAEGAELVVFPEAFVSGYPKGVSFGATVGIRARGGATGSAGTTRAASTSRDRQSTAWPASPAATRSTS